MFALKRSFSDRRSDKDRRKFFSLRRFHFKGQDRRVQQNRRSQLERRDGYVKIGKWSSVKMEDLKLAKYLQPHWSLKVRLSNFGWLPVHFHSIYQLIFLNPTSLLYFEPDLSRCESSKNALILPLIAFPIGFSVFLIPANQSVIVPTCHEIISEIRTLEISDLLPPKGINSDGGYNIVYFSLRI